MLNTAADKILSLCKTNDNTKAYAIIITSIMFIWSGIDKITNFNKKVDSLSKKTGWVDTVCIVGMISVIILEIFGFIILIDYFYKTDIILSKLNSIIHKKKLIKLILLAVIAFIALVTVIYHPPIEGKMIPFLNNLSLFGLFLYLYADMC